MRIIVPQVGQSIAEATIVKWFKQEGDFVEKGEPLVEIGTDKINTELPAPESGLLEQLLVKEGETVPVQTEIAILNEGANRSNADAPGPTVPLPLPYSPVVRKLAEEHDINLDEIRGTGTGGRVTRDDVLKIVEQRKSTESTPVESRVDERVPMSRMRKLIAEHMAHSRHTAADVSTFFEVDMTEVARLREKTETKLTFLPFVVGAVVKALKAYPVLNSSIDGDAIIYKKQINIGVAVALDDGLIVPVLKNADQKNIYTIASELQNLSERARNKRLNPDDLDGGTFTITNPGVFGALMGTPIIHQPQVAILELGAVVKRPVVVANDAIAIRSMAYFSLSYDHRALDGATADRFLAHIKRTLENECQSLLE
ncbi:MAG: 2-oxo acid dehydrogenase subunit E2 [Acidobacteria bacterium]|nr:MAG: 2-oxo acid dehydrogenase subunit E2 [Acidobacteriota bacterium]